MFASRSWWKLSLTETNEKLWDKIRDLFISRNNSDDRDKKYLKIEFNSDDEKVSNFNIIINVRSVFQEGNKYYPQVFLR